jgi:hypothetical protein
MIELIITIAIIILVIFILHFLPEKDLRNIDKYPEDKP